MSNDPLKLIKWADEGYMPVDLNENVEHVLALIKEIQRLREAKVSQFNKAENYLQSCPEAKIADSAGKAFFYYDIEEALRIAAGFEPPVIPK